MYSVATVPMFHSGSISSRNDFGQLLNTMELKGTAVEIGTHHGDFAKSLLLQWHGKQLLCVDPWKATPEYAEQELLLANRRESREEDYKVARRNLYKYIYDHRCVLYRMTSAKAAERVTDGALDFVYLDGDHRTEAVLADLQLWWPKLRSGGVLAGHDLVCPGEKFGGWAGMIQPAVFSFFAERVEHLPVNIVVERGGEPWSFYVVKQ